MYWNTFMFQEAKLALTVKQIIDAVGLSFTCYGSMVNIHV